jgi:hypothetical protein
VSVRLTHKALSALLIRLRNARCRDLHHFLSEPSSRSGARKKPYALGGRKTASGSGNAETACYSRNSAMQIDAIKLPLHRCVHDALAICANLTGSTARERRARLDHMLTESDAFSTLRAAVNVPPLDDQFFRDTSWCETDKERSAAHDRDLLTYIAWFFEEQFSVHTSSQLDDPIFEKSWHEFIVQVSRPTLLWSFVIPLRNLGLTQHVDEFAISPQLRIARLSKTERQHCRGKLDASEVPHAAAKWTTTAPRQIALSPASAADVAERVVAALRCVCTHQIWAEEVSVSADDLFESHSLSWRPFEWTGHRGIPLFPDENFVVLTSNSASQVAALYQLFARFEYAQASFLEVLRRFNSSSERVNRRDMLLDCWVALERLLLPEHGRTKAEPLARRLTRLLKSSDPNTTTETVRRSYRLRSKIVHGSGDHDEFDLHRVAWETYQLLRCSLIAVATMPPPFDPTALK